MWAGFWWRTRNNGHTISCICNQLVLLIGLEYKSDMMMMMMMMMRAIRSGATICRRRAQRLFKFIKSNGFIVEM